MYLMQGWTQVAYNLKPYPLDGLVHAVDESVQGYPSRSLCGETIRRTFAMDWPPKAQTACPQCTQKAAALA